MEHTARNFHAHGGAEWVIGGKLTFLPGATVEGAAELGTIVGKLAQENGVTEVVFDRGGHLYHGRVKALAEAAREGGLKF